MDEATVIEALSSFNSFSILLVMAVFLGLLTVFGGFHPFVAVICIMAAVAMFFSGQIVLGVVLMFLGLFSLFVCNS